MTVRSESDHPSYFNYLPSPNGPELRDDGDDGDMVSVRILRGWCVDPGYGTVAVAMNVALLRG